MSNTETGTLNTQIKPSQALRRHFLSLGRQIVRWSEKLSINSVAIGLTCLDRKTGSSTVSFNLSAAISSITERDVLFVESDFGKPYLHRGRGMKNPAGLSDVLKGDTESGSVISRLKDEPHLFAMSAGKAKESESVELPLSNLRNVITDQMSEFDFTLFDLPIADGLSACDSLAAQMDGIILVVEATDIDQRRIESFRNRMHKAGIEIIGLVINKA
jgi:Mrp family chromosome partitioning ATPase